MIPRIRFSTTRGWNPGDEIINLGIFNIFNELYINYEPLIYNRSPFEFNYEHARAELVAEPSDYVVFAGSPEWWQESLGISGLLRGPLSWRRIMATLRPGRAEQVNDLLMDEILTHSTHCSFIGVGSSKVPSIGPRLEKVLDEYCDALIVRDQQTADVVRKWNPVLLPCPALFAASSRHRSRAQRVGISLQKPNRGMIRIARSEMRWMETEVAKLLQSAPDAEFIAHTQWDAEYLAGEYPAHRIHLAASGKELINCYEQFDFIASSRLHGCILACSLGIPVYQLNYGLRMQALNEFPVLNRNDHGGLAEIWEKLDVAAHSTVLIDFKKRVRKEYHKHLSATAKSITSLAGDSG